MRGVFVFIGSMYSCRIQQCGCHSEEVLLPKFRISIKIGHPVNDGFKFWLKPIENLLFIKRAKARSC